IWTCDLKRCWNARPNELTRRSKIAWIVRIRSFETRFGLRKSYTETSDPASLASSRFFSCSVDIELLNDKLREKNSTHLDHRVLFNNGLDALREMIQAVRARELRRCH